MQDNPQNRSSGVRMSPFYPRDPNAPSSRVVSVTPVPVRHKEAPRANELPCPAFEFRTLCSEPEEWVHVRLLAPMWIHNDTQPPSEDRGKT